MLSVPPGFSNTVITQNGPTDSVSVEYGNGYDICGELEYTLRGTNSYTDKYMTFSKTVNEDAVDLLTFGLKSFPTGTFILYKMTLEVFLKNYPTATSAFIPVTFKYRECAPFNFKSNFDGKVIELFAGESYPNLDVSIS